MQRNSVHIPWIPAEATTVQELVHLLNKFPNESARTKVPSASIDLHKPIVIKSSPPPLHALLIGINKYKDKQHCPELQGCVPDVKAVQAYLLNNLRVPSANIRTMFDEQATRANIEGALRQLASDPSIKRDDPILIYYSGHGGSANAPKGWPANFGPEDRNPQVQMLIPHDFMVQGSDDALRGQGILDLVFAQLLEDMAEKKGDNITVILDSCHSGSGTRGGPVPFISRGIDLPPDYEIPLSILDQVGLKGKRGSVISNGFLTAGLRSHVLLAGCLPEEYSGEVNKRGLFTKAFLDDTLVKYGIEGMTYGDLIRRLPDIGSDQHPQCEGVNRSRLLFDSKVKSPLRGVYVVKFTGGKFVMNAGQVNGITPGTQFDVYSDDALTKKVGSLEVDQISAVQTVMKLVAGSTPFKLQTGYALKTRVGTLEDIAVYIPLHDKFLPIWQKVVEGLKDHQRRGIRLMDDPQNAQLVLSLAEDDRIQYQYADATAQQLGL